MNAPLNKVEDRAAFLADRKAAEKDARFLRRAHFAEIAMEGLRRLFLAFCDPEDRRELVRACVTALAVIAAQELGGQEAASAFGAAEFRCLRSPERGSRVVFSFEGDDRG